MKKLEFAFNRLEDVLNLALRIVGILLILGGGYAVYDNWMIYYEVRDDSVLNFRPGYESTTPDDGRRLTEDFVAWLTLDGTEIDYPVMQGEDNNEYLNKNPFGEYSVGGSIFLDSTNDSDFKDFYSLVYGHHMEQGAMFGALDDFRNEEYFNSHRTGSLTVNDVKYPLRTFAVLDTDATLDDLFVPQEGQTKALPYALKYAFILDKEAKPKGDERMVALSTCKYPATADRTVVLAVLETKYGRKIEKETETDKPAPHAETSRPQ